MRNTVAILLIIVLSLSLGCLGCKPKVSLVDCENASTELSRNNCYEYGLHYVECESTCQVLSGYWRDRCYLQLASKKGELRLCEEIVNESLIRDCTDTVLST